MSKHRKSPHLHPFIHIGLFSPHFPPPTYDDENVEELNILSDVNEIDMIQKHQSLNEYEYENDLKTWIR